jgi:hypothetical protein
MRKIIIGFLATAIIGSGAWEARALDEASQVNENGKASPTGEVVPSGAAGDRTPRLIS